jgi:hypothetical protein
VVKNKTGREKKGMTMESAIALIARRNWLGKIVGAIQPIVMPAA